jgi:hypothetical protein
MTRRVLLFAGLMAAIATGVSLIGQPAAQAAYFPDRFEWTHRAPQDVGMNAALVADAVQQAVASETVGSRDMVEFLKNSFGREPSESAVRPPASSSTAVSSLPSGASRDAWT